MKHDPYNLRKLMIEHNISANKLAPIIGIHRETLGKHLNGQADYTGTVLCKLADYFDVSTDYLLGRSKNGS